MAGKKDPKTIRNAATYMRAALGEFRHDHTPEEWAETNFGLATALAVFGGMERSVSSYRGAIKSLEDAGLVLTQESSPAEWVAVQIGLSIAYMSLGILTTNAHNFEKSRQILFDLHSFVLE